MKKCKYCGTVCDDEMVNCPACGSNEFEHKCPNCGMISETPFCPNCGVKFDAKKHICPVCGNSFFTNACPSCGYTLNKMNGIGYVQTPVKVSRPIVVDKEVKNSVVNATKTVKKGVSKIIELIIAIVGYFFCFFCFVCSFVEGSALITIGYILTTVLALPLTKKIIINKFKDRPDTLKIALTARAILVFVLFFATTMVVGSLSV